MHARISIAVVLALMAVPCAACADPWNDPAPAYTVSAPQEQTIVMSDGVALKGDVYRPLDAKTGRPATGTFPVILAITPYSKRSVVTTSSMTSGGNGFFPFLVQHGFINAVVDVRGTGSSEGDFELFGARERQDGAELVKWAAGLPGANGRVGMAGFSYVGLDQVLTAALVGRHSPLKAIFPVTTGNDTYRDIAFGGGMPNLDFAATWLALRSTMTAAQPDHPDPATSIEHGASRTERFGALDASLYVEADLSGPRGFEGAFWLERAPRRYLPAVVRNGVPAFMWSGWLDVYQRGAALTFAGLQNAWARDHRYRRRAPDTAPMRTHQPVTGRYQLTVGPWFHDPSTLGMRFQETQLAWFERWLKGLQNGIDRTSTPLHAYLIGENRFADARGYPVPQAPTAEWHLAPGPTGTAVSLNDGALAQSAPKRALADRLAWSDARSPCDPTLDQWNTGLAAQFISLAGLPGSPCWTDDSSVQAGALTYTSAPFDRPRSIAGPLSASLWMTSTAPDAEVAVTLEDVGPDNRSHPLTTGALLGSLRVLDEPLTWRDRQGRLLIPYHPYAAYSASDLQPGTVERLDVEVPPVFATIAKGHRLRVTITSGATALQPSVAQARRLAGGVYLLRAGVVDVPMADPAALPTSAIKWE